MMRMARDIYGEINHRKFILTSSTKNQITISLWREKYARKTPMGPLYPWYWATVTVFGGRLTELTVYCILKQWKLKHRNAVGLYIP